MRGRFCAASLLSVAALLTVATAASSKDVLIEPAYYEGAQLIHEAHAALARKS